MEFLCQVFLYYPIYSFSELGHELRPKRFHVLIFV